MITYKYESESQYLGEYENSMKQSFVGSVVKSSIGQIQNVLLVKNLLFLLLVRFYLVVIENVCLVLLFHLQEE